MNVRINQGYVITDSIHIGKAEFVIGEMSNTPAPLSHGSVRMETTISGVIT